MYDIVKSGFDSGLLSLALMPMIGFLTTRRLGALVPLKGSDIKLKYEVYGNDPKQVPVHVATIADWSDEDGNIWTSDLKTELSKNSFVLHSVLAEIGFIDWAMTLGDEPVFNRFFLSGDPSSLASKVLNRHLKENRCSGREVFHSTRHDGVSHNRIEVRIEQAIRHQAGHAQLDEHDKYGSKTLPEPIARELATAKLPCWNKDLIPMMKKADFAKIRAADLAAGKTNRRKRG